MVKGPLLLLFSLLTSWGRQAHSPIHNSRYLFEGQPHNPYQVLNMRAPREGEEAAFEAALQRRYRQLVTQHHPDRVGDAARREIQRINWARDSVRTTEARQGFQEFASQLERLSRNPRGYVGTFRTRPPNWLNDHRLNPNVPAPRPRPQRVNPDAHRAPPHQRTSGGPGPSGRPLGASDLTDFGAQPTPRAAPREPEPAQPQRPEAQTERTTRAEPEVRTSPPRADPVVEAPRPRDPIAPAVPPDYQGHRDPVAARRAMSAYERTANSCSAQRRAVFLDVVEAGGL